MFKMSLYEDENLSLVGKTHVENLITEYIQCSSTDPVQGTAELQGAK